MGGGCKSVGEATVACNVARAACGPWAAVLVALESYVIPVQIDSGSDVTLEDLVWYNECMCEANVRIPTGSLDKFKSASRDSETRFEEWCQEVRTLRTPPRLDEHQQWLEDSKRCWWASRDERSVFPTKKEQFEHKINLWFKDVWHDLVKYYPRIAYVIGGDPKILGGMHNDTATAWAMWIVTVWPTLHGEAIGVCSVLRRLRGMLKTLNTQVKALGLQSTVWGTLVCELETMEGRGVKRIDPIEDVRTRIDEEAFYREKGVKLDAAKLRECIRNVVRDEMSCKPEWRGEQEYWTRRWLFTKAGAHSQYGEERWLGKKLDLPERPTRREASEEMDECVIARGDPRVDAGFSEKLEHGKTRAIYGCDTRSYFTFDYLLRPVEAVWRNRHVLLDPGRRPQCDFYRTIGKKGGYKYMLDFDDFNSQHTLEAMKMCIEVACEGAPPHVLAWALESWDNMYVHWQDTGGVREAKMVGTLPSGHRATTFINTILNAAYCQYACGDTLKKVNAYHCGDDVVILGREDRVSQIVRDMSGSPFRVNPAKQSVGRATGEFLRVAFNEKRASGYVARAISSLVSGNWVTETRLDKKSYVETLTRAFWTVCARGRTSGVGCLGTTSLTRWVPETQGIAYPILMHELSVDGTPCKARFQTYGVSVVRMDGGRGRALRKDKSSGLASKDFMANHVDYKLLKAAGISPKRLYGVLLDASRKPRQFGESGKLSYYFDRSLAWIDCSLQSLINGRGREGKGREEALLMLRLLYKDVDWRRLVAVIRGTDDSSMTVDGKSAWPVYSQYELPFSDCMQLRTKLSWAAQVGTDYPVRV